MDTDSYKGEPCEDPEKTAIYSQGGTKTLPTPSPQLSGLQSYESWCHLPAGDLTFPRA